MNVDAARGHNAIARRGFIADIAQRVAGVRPTTALPSASVTDLRASADGADLTVPFAAEAEAAGCRVHRSDDAGWVATVVSILRDAAAQRVLIEPQPGSALTLARTVALDAALRAAGMMCFNECDDDALFAADASVTGVRLAVAETGTLVCASGPTSAQAASLVPPLHIALVAASQITADLLDAFELLGRDALSACVSLISGPSKTADIEGVLVTGMHGPRRVHVVILPG